MDIANIEVGQELIYLTVFNRLDYGPRIRVTQIHGLQVVGVILESVCAPWPVGSLFLGLAKDFHLPEDVPA